MTDEQKDEKAKWFREALSLAKKHSTTPSAIALMEMTWELKALNKNLETIDTTLRDFVGNGDYNLSSIVSAISKINR